LMYIRSMSAMEILRAGGLGRLRRESLRLPKTAC